MIDLRRGDHHPLTALADPAGSGSRVPPELVATPGGAFEDRAKVDRGRLVFGIHLDHGLLRGDPDAIPRTVPANTLHEEVAGAVLDLFTVDPGLLVHEFGMEESHHPAKGGIVEGLGQVLQSLEDPLLVGGHGPAGHGPCGGEQGRHQEGRGEDLDAFP